MERILLIDDAPEFQFSVKSMLSDRYEVVIAGDAEEARQSIQSGEFDLILMDISLPDQDGFSLLRSMKDGQKIGNTPVMFLTGRGSIEDKLTGFRLGAEDYVTKPFEPLEFIARVDNRINKFKASRTDHEVIKSGPFFLNLPQQRLFLTVGHRSHPVQLTPIEFRLLMYFLSHIDHVVSRGKLVEIAMGSGIHVLERTIDKHICSLRKKIEPYSESIKTIFGQGYRFSAAEISKVVIAKSS
jgi:two-component system phosphate regulon response regulator PhoB